MNVISEIVDDETYEKLFDARMLNAVSIRNYLLRKRYKELRATGLKPEQAFRALHKTYYYMDIKSIKRIIYDKY